MGVILDIRGRVLIAQRPKTAHQGGLWEFPGGKVKADETVEQALIRELAEEIGITATTCTPWLQIYHAYDDKTVGLEVWRVTAWEGAARGCEGQPIRWVALGELENYPFPVANRPILLALQSGGMSPEPLADSTASSLKLAGIGAAMFLTALAVGYFGSQPVAVTAQNLDCNAALEVCEVEGDGWSMALRFGEGEFLTTLQPFAVSLTVQPSIERVGLFFWMENMDMGPNRTRLVQTSEGHWQGKAMLPLCTEDRDDWRVTVMAENGRDHYAAAFAFTAKRR